MIEDIEAVGAIGAALLAGLILGSLIVFYYWEKERQREHRKRLELKVHIANLQHKLKEMGYKPNPLSSIDVPLIDIESIADNDYIKTGGADPK